jgi:hypothetical protein
MTGRVWIGIGGGIHWNTHQTKQASASLDQANDALGRMVRETFKW